LPVVAILLGLALGIVSLGAQGGGVPDPHRRFHALGDFRLESGVVLPNAKVAFATFGELNADRSNVVLLPSWYNSDHHGYDFLIGANRALDPAKYFIVATEMFANGWSSSPSNTPEPFHGPRFPAIAIRDDVEAARRVLMSEFGITRAHAIVGYSMGAQQALQWAVSHPDFTDRIVAYCGTAKTYGHGVVRLESAISALTANPVFNNGDYTALPSKGLAAWADHWTAWTRSQEWFRLELFKPGSATVEQFLERSRGTWMSKDPNDLISQARTWQHHNVADTPGLNVSGDIERALPAIKARVLYMPSQTDLYFPIGDFQYESRFIRSVTLVPIPSILGHLVSSAADRAFINTEIQRFLE
jgi:homoserine O-acetyltransferase